MGFKHPCWTAHIGFETLLVYNAVCPRRSSTVDHRPSAIGHRPSAVTIITATTITFFSFSSFSFSLFLFFLCLSANVTTTRYAFTASYCDSTSNFFFSPYILLWYFLLFLFNIYYTRDVFIYKTYVKRYEAREMYIILSRQFYFKSLERKEISLASFRRNDFEAIRICRITFNVYKLNIIMHYIVSLKILTYRYCLSETRERIKGWMWTVN